MAEISTSCDIYLGLKGKKVAVVQSYVSRLRSDGRYNIELTMLYATDEAIRDGINFYELEDFSLVICKPNRKIIYSGCQWIGIGEAGVLGSMKTDYMSVVASTRKEVSHDTE